MQAGMVHHGRPVVCKPNRQAFDIALRLAGGAAPSATLWLDDSARNITTGHRLGLYSVLVGRTGMACPSDQQIRHIHNLPAALPWLWQGQQPPPTPAALPPHEAGEGADDGGVAAALKAAAAAAKAGGGSAASEASETIEAVYAATA